MKLFKNIGEWLLFLFIVLVFLVLMSIAAPDHDCKGATPPRTKKSMQKQIDSARVLQIQNAMIQRGMLVGPATGKWDDVTQDACRRVADKYKWQTDHMPDARLLILLGLANGDPAAVTEGGRLDQLQRSEAARRAAQGKT